MSTGEPTAAAARKPHEREPTDTELRRVRWIWPFPPVNPHVAAFVGRATQFTAPLVDGWRWLPAALVVGVVPVLANYFVRLPIQLFASAFLLFPMFVATVRAAKPARAFAVLAATFFAHSVAVIVLAARDPGRAAAFLPGAESFWTESLHWIETGTNPEYEVRHWLPQHLLLAVAVICLGYCSLGLTVLLRGFYEVDLMNYYVGRLIGESGDAATALIYGWHVWSLVRGAGCALVMYEIAAVSLAALTGEDRGAGRGRRLRLAAGVALLVLDGVLKFLLMDGVQARLQANLL